MTKCMIWQLQDVTDLCASSIKHNLAKKCGSPIHILKNLRRKRKKSEEVLCTGISLSQSDLQDDLVILSGSD